MEIEKYKRLCTDDTIAITQHANRRFQERGIKIDDIEAAILNGEIIEEYPEDTPFPSCLILGRSTKNLPLHVVLSTDEEFLYIITAYYPNLEKWKNDLKTRRE
jgi:hypothetical protein